MDVVTIFYILLLFSASSLCIALIINISRIAKSIKEVEADVKDLSLQIKPLIASTTNLSEKLNYITDQAKGQIETTKSIISDFRVRADKILELEEKIRGGIEGPVNKIIKSFSAVANGFNTFWTAYKNSKG